MLLKEQIQAMQKLGFTPEEIQDIAQADAEIDKNGKLFELTKEQKKNSKDARQVSRKPAGYVFTPRERKSDTNKKFLIDLLLDTLHKNDNIIDSIVVENAEREITFCYNNRKFKIVLSAPRK